MSTRHLVCFYSVKHAAYTMTTFLGEMDNPIILSPSEDFQIHIHTPVSMYRHFLKSLDHGAATQETIRMFSTHVDHCRKKEIEDEIFSFIKEEKRKMELLRETACNVVEMTYPLANKKIRCIKMIRQITGCGLRESMEAYDKAWEEKVEMEKLEVETPGYGN